MAVAWSKDKVGRASGDVIVRDPVVLTATLAALPAHRRQAARCTSTSTTSRARRAPTASPSAPRAPSPSARAARKSLQLRAKQRDRVTVPLNASGAGPATVKVAIKGPGDFALERSYVMNVKPATQVLARRTVKPIAKGESLTLSNDLFADLVPGTGTVAVSVGVSTALDAATLLKALDRYPYRLLRADHQPGDAAALCQRARERRRIWRSTTPSTSASATPSIACWRASRRTARSASGASAATTPGSTPT